MIHHVFIQLISDFISPHTAIEDSTVNYKISKKKFL